jgi:hypothetical protein
VQRTQSCLAVQQKQEFQDLSGPLAAYLSCAKNNFKIKYNTTEVIIFNPYSLANQIQPKLTRIDSHIELGEYILSNAVFNRKNSVAVSTIHFIFIKKLKVQLVKEIKGVRFHFIKKCLLYFYLINMLHVHWSNLWLN